jgi:hypothetical protein
MFPAQSFEQSGTHQQRRERIDAREQAREHALPHLLPVGLRFF